MERLFYSAVVVGAAITGLVGSAGSLQTQPRTPPAAATNMSPADPALARLAEALPTLDEKTRRGLALQVALDRAGFSPGEIDGAPGTNTDRAMAAYKAAHGTTDFTDGYTNPVVTYSISAEDVAGPFVESIPDDMVEKAKLQSLGYVSILEMLGERFHASPKLLQRLNPKATFTEGEVISVPNVEPFFLSSVSPAKGPDAVKASGDRKSAATSDAERASGKTTRDPVSIVVTDRTKTLEVQNAAGKVIFHAPVTVGSKNDPLPIGEWKVNGVSRLPVFNYNPDLFWDADPSHAKAKIPAGPNNPVGVVWIDLSKEHYGIHGTPEPSRIGYTESHGCIRLTNWDAARLATLVAPGTKVVLR